jgi:hypothetical protein
MIFSVVAKRCFDGRARVCALDTALCAADIIVSLAHIVGVLLNWIGRANSIVLLLAIHTLPILLLTFVGYYRLSTHVLHAVCAFPSVPYFIHIR